MIISASRRTDLPAFYSDWFIHRIRAGFFSRVNPFNPRQVAAVSLLPGDVDAICFWSKNPRPLLAHLEELDRRGLHYYFQFTLNPYGRLFEQRVPPLTERLAIFRELAGRIGPQRVIWRYDPVILTSVTPVDWHIEHVERLADQLKSATGRLVFSFYDFYGKGQGRLHAALQGSGVRLDDITAPAFRAELDALAAGFRRVADRHQLRLFTCSEALDLSRHGIEHGACIDGQLIRELFGRQPPAVKDRNQRPACRCVSSVDMGSYNSCPFGCLYCYANHSARVVEANLRRHDPQGEALIHRDNGSAADRRKGEELV